MHLFRFSSIFRENKFAICTSEPVRYHIWRHTDLFLGTAKKEKKEDDMTIQLLGDSASRESDNQHHYVKEEYGSFKPVW